ncbi:MAG TPA: type II secretion system protein [Magnetospirillaceae bacterium]|nr:type II secretion system protein [Magnetospirillaceae bacterium]
MIRRANTQGFTLIELMIALAFVAFILIFATTAVIQVMQTYNKGIAVKQINQAGRSTLEDMSRYIRSADPAAVNTAALASSRRVCFGGVSYVWNLYNTPAASANKYDDGSALTLTRVNDAASAMCTSTAGAYPAVPKAQAADVLSSNVWVMALTVSQPTVAVPLVDISIKLAVANDPTISAGQCITGGTVGQFCATSDFSTTVIAGGGN